jgi:DNA-directed RNA polymerase specialized sigma24 family protein
VSRRSVNVSGIDVSAEGSSFGRAAANRNSKMFFPSTHWSELRRASLDGETEADRALEALCRRYWSPLKHFVRQRGYSEAEAEDLTQGFIVHLIQHETLDRAERRRGKFRSFLLGALILFLSDERDRRNAAKRGGGSVHLRLDGEIASQIVTPATSDETTEFDRAWALAILQRAFGKIREDYAAAGRAEVFDLLRRFLPGSSEPPPYEQAAAELGMQIGAFNSEIHRLRGRFKEYVRAEVATTVSAPHEIDQEMTHLHSVLMNRGTDFSSLPES